MYSQFPFIYRLQANAISQLYYTKSLSCLFGFVGFWIRHQFDKLEHRFIAYVFTQPGEGKIAVFHVSSRMLQKPSKCNKKGKSGEKNLKVSFRIEG